MSLWQLQEAKSKFSSLIKLCETGPQIISVRGQEKAVMLSMLDYNLLISGENANIVSFLRSSPLMGENLDLNRDCSPGRNVEL